MNNTVGKSNVMVRAGMRLIKIYIAAAFVFWKWSCLFIAGDDGLFFNFTASPWSLAIGGGYVLGVVILLGHAIVEFRSKQYQGITSTLIFTGLGLLFLVLGAGFSNLTVSSVGSLAILGMNALMLYYSFKGLRYFKNRAFVYWVWGYSINLVREIGMKCYTEASTPAMDGMGNAGWFWNLVQDFGLSALHAEWLLEFYWLGHIVSSVLIAVGLILLVHQLAPEISRPFSTNTAKYVAVGVLFMLIGLYPSLVYFGSPGFVTTCVVNAVMLVYSLSACRRSNSLCFALWAWASGITFLLTVVSQFHRTWVYPPREFDQIILELLVLGGLVAGILWVAGLMVALRQLAPVKLPDESKTETIPEVVLYPRPPGWMKKRLAIIISIGGLAVGIVWLRQNDPSQVFSLEPKYEGHTLSYWMDHWYLNPWGGAVNSEAQAAIKSMETKAVPYLVDWIGRPYNSYPGMNYPERALKGFAVLGPAAKPAVPKLIKMIGNRSGYPMRALLCIGPDAVPALANKLVETLADTNPPTMNWRSPRFETSNFHVQECVIQTLSQMGTNAEAAVPALIKAVISRNPWTQAEAAGALASVGHNQPDTVIPVLINALTNSETGGMNQGAIAGALGSIGGSCPDIVIPVLINVLTNASTDPMNQAAVAVALASVGKDKPNIIVPVLIGVFTNIYTNPAHPSATTSGFIYRQRFNGQIPFPVYNSSIAGSRAGIADALAAFGRDARTAVPSLLLAGQSTNADLRAHAAIAVQKIAPETPDALAPLIKNLAEKDTQVRKQALWTLESLGTNAVEALPALTRQCLHDPVSEVRTIAMRCISNIGQFNDEVIIALGENAINTNDSVGQQAVSTLGGFANKSKLAFLELAKAMSASPVNHVRQGARNSLEMMLRNDSGMLVECLEDTNSQTRYQGLRMVDEFGSNIPSLPQTTPALKKALHDDNLEARSFATNMLIQIYSESYGRQVAELLVRGGNLNATNDQGQTVLHVQILSFSSPQRAAITALLGAGANPNIKDKLGRTPAHLLLTEHWPWEGVGEMFSLLVNGGVDLSAADNNGQTPLHYLAALGSQSPLFFIRGIGDIFDAAKVDIEARDNDGNTPLHIAVKTGTRDVYDWLIKHGASLDVTNNAGQTPRQLAIHSTDPFARFGFNSDTDIYQAIREGKVESVASILKAEPDLLNKTNQFGQTPLSIAAQAHRTNIVEFLDKQGVQWDPVSAVLAGRMDVLRNLITQQPRSATDGSLLRLAAANGQAAAVEMLLAAGSDLKATDSFGLSPLGNALVQQHNDVANLLVKRGATKNIFDAVLADDSETAAALIDKDKSLVSATNAQGVSVAEIAAAAGNEKTLKLLLDQGVSPDFKNVRTGKSLLHAAAAYNQTNTAKLLIQRRAKVDVADNSGLTPLHVSALRGSTEVLELLLKHKADCNVRTVASKTAPPSAGGVPIFPGRPGLNLEGNTALHLAALNAQTNAIELLLKWGASINATNPNGITALDLAGQFGPPPFFLMNNTDLRLPFAATAPNANRDNPNGRRKAAAALLEQAGGKHGKHGKNFHPGGMPMRIN